MQYIIIATNGRRAKPLGFTGNPLVFASYEAALEHAYATWLNYPEHEGCAMYYAVYRV